ncbi:2-hydroxycarboxylate transporter family protein [Wukongibacter sp. M2B1]|uniref:2-hydroxycarboxylate transporter family protein n=1 Tax=Wukongibacter sp. M2B1 TaxID=3088895 RepID=UPI003D7A5CB9
MDMAKENKGGGILKEVKIIGIPLYIYIPLGVLIFIAMKFNWLTDDMIGAYALCLFVGSLFMYIGAKIPIVNDFLGGPALLPLFGGSILAYYGVIPQTAVETVGNFMNSGFQNLYIASLIVGSIISMNRKTLIKASARFLPVIIGSQVFAIISVLGATLLVRKEIFDGVFMVGLPVMSGGSGAAMTTLPTLYADLLNTDFDKFVSPLMASLTVANVLAIVGAGFLDKVGRMKPNWTGHGNILMDEGKVISDSNASKKDYSKADIKSFASGLLVTTVIYTLGNIVGEIIPQIHMLAWTIILVAVIKALNILPENVVDGCINWYNLMMKNLLPVLIAGIGIAKFDFTAAVAALQPANLFIIIVGIVAATASAMFIGKFFGLYPVETGVAIGLCACNVGGSGDLAVLMGAKRMNLLPFASITTRIGGALMVVWIGFLLPLFG